MKQDKLETLRAELAACFHAMASDLFGKFNKHGKKIDGFLFFGSLDWNAKKTDIKTKKFRPYVFSIKVD